ncbi:hypothetical protein [Nocardioides antri]|uniref:LppX_LprAFG lipoprotein n=1 Tax=Nocardioides antri TaxID=2607659 RepID=A0A5B1M804_9ACTN|nr:hypothetical protein [Nocardioides antri]KAA1429425.1 hypothetical protein F0U47_04370 [Nocardioides antri]
MQGLRRAATVAVLVLLGACTGGGTDQRGATSSTPAPDDVDAVLAEAVERTLAHDTLDFEIHTVDGRLLEHTRGTAVPGGWQASTDLGYFDEHSTIRARAVEDRLWIQVSSWPRVSRDCWMLTPPNAALFGIGAMSAGRPGYLTLLEALEPVEFTTALHDEITADAPLASVLGFLSAPFFHDSTIDWHTAERTTIRVTVEIEDGEVAQVAVWASDFRAALARARSRVRSLSADRGGSAFRIQVHYAAGDDDVRLVEPGPDQQVVKLKDGCGYSA